MTTGNLAELLAAMGAAESQHLDIQRVRLEDLADYMRAHNLRMVHVSTRVWPPMLFLGPDSRSGLGHRAGEAGMGQGESRVRGGEKPAE